MANKTSVDDARVQRLMSLVAARHSMEDSSNKSLAISNFLLRAAGKYYGSRNDFLQYAQAYFPNVGTTVMPFSILGKGFIDFLSKCDGRKLVAADAFRSVAVTPDSSASTPSDCVLLPCHSKLVSAPSIHAACFDPDTLSSMADETIF